MRAQDPTQGDPLRLLIVLPEQAGLEPIEARDLFRGGQLGMVGDVVGDAHEFVIGEDRGTMPPPDQKGRNWKVLVTRALPGAKLCTGGHRRLGAFTSTRPFHCPPRRRTCW